MPTPTNSPPTCHYLVDSSIYVFSAWYRYPDELVDTQGNPVNAVHGFTDFTYRLLTEHKPTQITFAFDLSLGQNFRNDIYPQYKAHRPSAPESLKRQFSYCRQWLDALGIDTLANPRYEADDIIGTLVRRNQKNNITSYIITNDKDLMQLVGENDLWWSYHLKRQLTHKNITKKLGIPPEKFSAALAIAGDKVDNIPGTPGIGIATAAKILKHFDNLESLLENTNKVTSLHIRGAKRLAELIQENQDTIRVAKQLTDIYCDVEIEPSYLSGEIKKPNLVEIKRLITLFDLPNDLAEKWVEYIEQ